MHNQIWRHLYKVLMMLGILGMWASLIAPSHDPLFEIGASIFGAGGLIGAFVEIFRSKYKTDPFMFVGLLVGSLAPIYWIIGLFDKNLYPILNQLPFVPLVFALLAVIAGKINKLLSIRDAYDWGILGVWWLGVISIALGIGASIIDISYYWIPILVGLLLCTLGVLGAYLPRPRA